MIVLATTIKVKDGKGKEFERAYKVFQPKAIKDPGTLAYILHHSPNDNTKYFIFEKFESEEALKYHVSSPHFKTYSQVADPLFVGKPVVEFYQEV